MQSQKQRCSKQLGIKETSTWYVLFSVEIAMLGCVLVHDKLESKLKREV